MNARSLKNLTDVHPALVGVVTRAEELIALAPPIGVLGFIVTEGVRTLVRQTQLVAAGASQTMRSRHLTGHAVDLAATMNGTVRWDWPLYDKLAIAMKAAAAEQKVAIEWGGDWKMRDGPHFQLTWKDYPSEPKSREPDQRSA